MIIEGVMNILSSVIGVFIDFLPQNINLPFWFADALSLLNKGLYIFPVDVWGGLLSAITFWTSVNFSWAIVEWVYKKIPGIN